MLTDVLHTFCLVINIHPIVSLFVRFPDYDKEHTAGVTGQQRMLTNPWHLILPLISVEVRICSAPVLYFSFVLLILNTDRYPNISFTCLNNVVKTKLFKIYSYDF